MSMKIRVATRTFLILASIGLFALTSLGQGKVILAVFAHADDENLVGPVLAKYARLGHKVYVVIATDGKTGGTRVTTIPAGEELGMLRMKETACACEKLGTEKPIFLETRLNTQLGVGTYLREHRSFKEKLKAQIERIDPNIIITFGPDGNNGHPEHIVAGSVVQELLLREGWVDRYPLYFPTYIKKQNEENAGYIDERYVNASVSFNAADRARYAEAAKCYVTQSTPQEIERAVEEAKDRNWNIFHFRRFGAVRTKRKTDLLK